ncbi:hypothetical protein [Actinoplanes sp. G11-F43]|uniref:hypothetical protein n=1 Tax=Actinoplanes sp. G11-F43 TaxID=3424130 RepID=UPI003D357FC5
MEIEGTTAPVSTTRIWLRRVAVGLACVPFALFSLVHTMGRSGDFGVLGEWYVMTPLTIATLLAWGLIEKTVIWPTK